MSQETNPYHSAEPYKLTTSDSLPVRAVFAGCLTLSVAALLFAIFVWPLPRRRGVQELSRRVGCEKNLRDIAQAIRDYERAMGTLPPAYTVDADGKRLHSWRTLILPYFHRRETSELYDSIDLTKAWNDPVNAKAKSTFVREFLCLSSAGERTHTTYLAVVGPEFAFSGSNGRLLADVEDLKGTILAIDVSEAHSVHWMSPEDIAEDTLLNSQNRFQHDHLFVAAFAVGDATSFNADISNDALRDMLTVADEESR
ncbi:MAG: DUF1559 domain-containing protein [Planctomycetota bacterium]